jgi:hypothetical protein
MSSFNHDPSPATSRDILTGVNIIGGNAGGEVIPAVYPRIPLAREVTVQQPEAVPGELQFFGGTKSPNVVGDNPGMVIGRTPYNAPDTSARHE